MTLKSLELNGFKSFGKKSFLSFSTPITSIVGPNGSGKSNIVEAIRFVLGEQSMKSLRGKGGVDLIFKGSKTLSSVQRASVSMTFDNSNKIFSFTNSDLGVSLSYDEITISREVFADGVNRYLINGTEVRLKDIVDLLASVNIGNSGHHIISQGEADRVLNAGSRDRRLMIEDALGLKVYQYRIRESERKLEKTLEHIKEVQSLRRELAPHLSFLKKQVSRIEKVKELRDEIRELYKIYLSAEATYITRETNRLKEQRRLCDEKIISLDERIARIPSISEKPTRSEEETHAILLEEEVSRLHQEKDELGRNLGRIDGLIERIDKDISRMSQVKEHILKEEEWKGILSGIIYDIEKTLSASSLLEITNALSLLKEKIKNITLSGDGKDHESLQLLQKEKEEFVLSRTLIHSRLEELRVREDELRKSIFSLREKDKNRELSLREGERVKYELIGERNDVLRDLQSISFEEESLTRIKTLFETDITEASVILGREVILFAQTEMMGEISRNEQDDRRRALERIKIKIEDSGAGNSAEVIKEYQETEERDQFLAREIDDLNTSIKTLRDIIFDLKETLDREFKTGVEKINTQFQNFFVSMFGGGSAFLSVVMEHKKSKKTDEDDSLDGGTESDDTNLGFERGIEIHISLPQKKVKDLNMLSGGERSLTSIALLFAISQVNPPPFLVLDETDAALDEANSRKYGNMLESLSRYSQLIVVTHNRETMSRAHVLYGVTMGAEGSSKLLSIKLEDARTYAK